MSAHTLIEKIQALPAERIAEIRQDARRPSARTDGAGKS